MPFSRSRPYHYLLRCVLFTALPLVAMSTAQPEEDPSLERIRTAVASQLRPQAPALDLSLPAASFRASYDPEANSITGHLSVHVRNDAEAPRSQLGFQLFANQSRAYTGTSISIGRASIDAVAVDAVLAAGGRGLLLAVPGGWQPGQWLHCKLSFTTRLGRGATQGRAGLLSRHQRYVTLYSWLPELAVWNGTYEFPAIPLMADPSYVQLVDYLGILRLPEAWSLVASGAERRSPAGDWLIMAPRVRNLALWLSPEPPRSLYLQTGGPDGIRVGVHSLDRQTLPAAIVASVAADTFRHANAFIGPYPRRSYDIVLCDFGNSGVGGMEASGLTFIAESPFAAIDWREDDPLMESGRDSLHTVVHEVLHSWWYDQVGNDTASAAWLDESLTQWCTLYIWEKLRGRAAMQKLASSHLANAALVAYGDKSLDRATAEMHLAEFAVLLYMRGPLLYEVLRQQAGEQRFFHTLSQWYSQNIGRTVDRAAWEAHWLPLLAEDDRAAFRATWIDGEGPLAPAALDGIIDPEILSRLRALEQQAAAAHAAGMNAPEANASDNPGADPPSKASKARRRPSPALPQTLPDPR